jgi:hypothetical protein
MASVFVHSIIVLISIIILVVGNSADVLCDVAVR